MDRCRILFTGKYYAIFVIREAPRYIQRDYYKKGKREFMQVLIGENVATIKIKNYHESINIDYRAQLQGSC